MRSHGKVPRTFKIDELEAEVRMYVDELDFERETAVKRRQWEQDAAREYEIIRVMAQHDDPIRVWEALQMFWETFEEYDPDGLEEHFKPMKKVQIYVDQSAISLFPYLVNAAKKLGVLVQRAERYTQAAAAITYLLALPELRQKFEPKGIPILTFRKAGVSDDLVHELAQLAR
jgi:hypothetical protein